MKRTYELHTKDDTKATITIEAPSIVGAEQNLVILDESSKPVAIIELQPGIDNREI